MVLDAGFLGDVGENARNQDVEAVPAGEDVLALGNRLGQFLRFLVLGGDGNETGRKGEEKCYRKNTWTPV